VRRHLTVFAGAALAVAVLGCTASDGDAGDADDAAIPTAQGADPGTDTPAAVEGDATAGTDQTDQNDEPDELVTSIVADLNDYWDKTSVELGFDFEPIPLDRLTSGADGVRCSGETVPAEDIEENAFVDPSCDEGITVAYDPAYVGVSLARAEATLAHEWGHVVQAQASELDISLDPEGLPIDAELQADCFAGAWAAQRAQADIELLREDTADTGDPVDIELDDPDAHGLPEERVTAFDIGLDGGAVACIDELLAALP